MENSPSHVAHPQSESRFTRSSRSEPSTTRTLMEVPLTRGKWRARSRSQDNHRTRAKTESRLPPHSLGHLLQRLHQSIISDFWAAFGKQDRFFYNSAPRNK